MNDDFAKLANKMQNKVMKLVTSKDYDGLRVSFKALQSALIKDSKTPKRQINVLDGVLDDVLADKIIEAFQSNPKVTQTELAKQLDVSHRSLQRKMDELKAAGRIERIGGKRYGKWGVKE